MRNELSFLTALWKVNLIAAMEYRASFITQIVGMILNNGVYFLFWVIFFNQFKEIRGWGLSEMFILFGIVAAGFGMAVFLFGNSLNLTEIIVNGQLDYYLSLPRPVLMHTLASRSQSSGLGDFTYGILSYILSQQLSVESFLRFALGTFFAMIVFLSFLVIVQSLAFWIGNAQLSSRNAINAIITFSIYPIHLFEGSARFLLFTIIPAAFIGALPAELVLRFNWIDFWRLLGGGFIFLLLAIYVFHRGLRRYESGSAIQVQP